MSNYIRNPMKSRFNVASSDVGYRDTKIKTPNAETTIRSIVGPAIKIAFSNDFITAADNDGLTVTMDGQTYFVGELARLQSPYPVGPQNRQRDLEIVKLLALTGLHEAGAKGTIDRLVTGLPVAWFDADKDALAETLTGTHELTVNGVENVIDVKTTVVVPQPLGTTLLHMLNAEGAFTDPLKLSQRKAGVIDIGYYTTDVSLINCRKYIQDFSGGTPTAGGAFFKLLRLQIQERYDLTMSMPDVEDAAHSGKIMIWSNEITLPPDLIAAALNPVTRDIMRLIKDRWSLDEAKTFSAIFVTGGNARLFFDAIEAVFPSAVLIDEPRLANARGFYRYALLQERVERDKRK